MYFASSLRMSSAVMTMTFGVLGRPRPARASDRGSVEVRTAGPRTRPAPSAALPWAASDG